MSAPSAPEKMGGVAVLLWVLRYLGMVALCLIVLPFLFALVVGLGGVVLFGWVLLALSDWEPRP